MKKLIRLPAILGGILCFLQVICYAKEILNSITGTYASFSIASLIYAAVNLLLGIALLRGRKDRLLAGILGANGIWMSVYAVWDYVGILQLSYNMDIPFPRSLGNICDLLIGLVFLLLALDCLLQHGIPLVSGKKYIRCLILLLSAIGIAASLWLNLSVLQLKLGDLIPVRFSVLDTLSAILTYCTAVCAGFAVAGSHPETP